MLGAAVLGARVVLGMCGVFARVFLVMRVSFMRFFAGFCRGRLDGGHIGQSYRGQSLAGMGLGAPILRLVVLIMFVMFVNMIVRMLMIVVIVMLRTGVMLGIRMMMFGVVGVIVPGV